MFFYSEFATAACNLDRVIESYRMHTNCWTDCEQKHGGILGINLFALDQEIQHGPYVKPLSVASCLLP